MQWIKCPSRAFFNSRAAPHKTIIFLLSELSVIHGGHAPAFHRVKFQIVVIPVRTNNDYSIVFRRRKRGFARSKRMLRELARLMMIALSVVVSSRSDPSSAGVHAKLRERSFRL